MSRRLVLLVLVIAVAAAAGCVENQAGGTASEAVSEHSYAVDVSSPAGLRAGENGVPSSSGADRGIVVSGVGKMTVTPDV
ncbi:MAG: hypothetical protein D6733_03030, partial [Methanobacteriota archaeon]